MSVIETIDIWTYNLLMIASIYALVYAFGKQNTNPLILALASLLSFFTAWSSFMVTDSNGNVYASYSMLGILFIAFGILGIVALIVKLLWMPAEVTSQ